MRSYIEKDFVLKFNRLYNELFTLESMLRTIKNVCTNNDINSNSVPDIISISNYSHLGE